VAMLPRIGEIAQRAAAEAGDSRSPRELIAAMFASMSPYERRAVLDDWAMWSLPYQRIPPGDWRRWAMIGGRGIGKSWTASKTVHEVAKDVGSLGGGIIAIVGRTHTDVRETNVEARATGILAAAPRGFLPRWKPGPGILEWPNGARGRVFSADGESAQSIRGSNIAFAIGDEVAAWKKGEETWWHLLEFATRVGRAQLMMTTTPRPLKWLKKAVDDADTVLTGASTFDNPFLTEKAIKVYRNAFEGAAIGEQELRGLFLGMVEGALLKQFEFISDHRIELADLPPMARVIVSVDPAVTAHRRSDKTGIAALGIDSAGEGYVLEDATDKYDISTGEWAEVAISLYRKYQADRVVAEVNRGGDMVEAGLRAVDRNIPFASVRATRSKFTRGEPVATLYERGKVHHVGIFPELEAELTTWIPGDSQSPNRLDSVVWGITYLMLSEDSPIRTTADGPGAYA